MERLWDILIALRDVARAELWAWVKENPGQTFFIALFIARLFGAKVESGWHGVLFSAGRARRVLEPGFHWLIPGIWTVRKVRSRSQTVDLVQRRVTTADGLVYEVDANLVFRVADPIVALTQIKDFDKGCRVALGFAIQELIFGRERSALRQSVDLDGELVSFLKPRLARWGIAIERAGFTSIAPSARSLRVSQLEARVRERAASYRVFHGAGLARLQAAPLLGAERHLVAHGRRRYESSPLGERLGRMLRAELRALDERIREAQRLKLKDELRDLFEARRSLLKNLRTVEQHRAQGGT